MLIEAEFEFTVRNYNPEKRYEVLQVVKDFVNKEAFAPDMMADIEDRSKQEQIVAYTLTPVTIGDQETWVPEITEAFRAWVAERCGDHCKANFRIINVE